MSCYDGYVVEVNGVERVMRVTWAVRVMRVT
jgi:hypothetical protein